MKHKWLACVLTACMLLCMLPFAAQAADEAGSYEAKIGDEYYKLAQTAINEAKSGDTVTLLQDVTTGISISNKTNLVVDGNGNTVSSVNFGGNFNNNVTLTNANFDIGATDPVVGVNGDDNKYITISNCTFTLGEDVQVSGANPWAAIYVQNQSEGLNIENNTFNINWDNEKHEFQCIGFGYTTTRRTNNTTITGNTMTALNTNLAYFIIGGSDGSGADYSITNLRVSNNKINDGDSEIYAINITDVDGLEITDNTFDCYLAVLLTTKTDASNKDVTITGNDGNCKKVIYLDKPKDLETNDQPITGNFKTDVTADKMATTEGFSSHFKMVTVTFNANGGNCDEAARPLVLTNGTPAAIGELPTPTHYGNYSFGGWYTEDGQRVTENTTFSENTTITARWNYTGPVGFNISVADTQHGTVTVDPTIADAGDTVTIKTKADTGYVVKSVTVTDTDGNKIDVTAAADGTYSFVMPRKSVKVAVTFAAGAAAMPFTDMDVNAYYYDAVCWAVMNDITNGVTDTTFGPDFSCTRAQMVTFLWRAAGAPKPATAENPFTDVNAGDYYYDAVLWAVEKGITKGVTDTTFCPNDTVSRAQTVTFLWRYDGAKITAGNSFTDVDSDAYYADAVEWAMDNGVTTGATGTTFAPNANCTRAQIVTFLYRYMG